MAKEKIQIRPDSYAGTDVPNASMQTLDSIPATSGFKFNPQVRTPSQDDSITDLVLEGGQSGDTPHGDDTFNMTHAMGQDMDAV